MCDFSKQSDVTAYLTTVLQKAKGQKIKAVFSLTHMSWHTSELTRTYWINDSIYILFEDDMALIINYLYMDALALEYRPLTSDEKEKYTDGCAEGRLEEDWFNCVTAHVNRANGKARRLQKCTLEYGRIVGFVLYPVSGKYLKWVNVPERSTPALTYVDATEETFDEIEFLMDNGKRISLCPDEADSDGYVYVWSDDVRITVENVKNHGC